MMTPIQHDLMDSLMELDSWLTTQNILLATCLAWALLSHGGAPEA